MNIINKPLAILNKKKRTCIPEIRNETEDISTDFAEIKIIIREHYE